MLTKKNCTEENIKKFLARKDLSLRAKGLMCVLLSLDETSLEILVDSSTDAQTSVRSGVAELEEAGYLVKERLRDWHGRLQNFAWKIDLQETE